MRLIDADELKKNYTNSFVNTYGVECAKMFKGVIDQTETAYDVEKVVEQLEEAKDVVLPIESEMTLIALKAYDVAIGIVRKGGVE